MDPVSSDIDCNETSPIPKQTTPTNNGIKIFPPGTLKQENFIIFSNNKKDDDANDEADTEIKYARDDISLDTSIEKEGSVNEDDVKYNN